MPACEHPAGRGREHHALRRLGGLGQALRPRATTTHACAPHASSSSEDCSVRGPTLWYPCGLLRSTPLSTAEETQLRNLRRGAARYVGREPGSSPTSDVQNDDAERSSDPFGIVLLNTEPGCPLLAAGSPSAEALAALWPAAAVVAVADGAANHLYDAAPDDAHRSAQLPHFIVGDLDSVRPEVLDYYTNAGVQIAPRPAQETHDFAKALALVQEELASRVEGGAGEEATVFVFCSAGGRFDHAAATISTLYENPRAAVVLFTPCKYSS